MARYEPSYTTTTVLAASTADIDYTPDDVTTPHSGQKMSRYLPRHAEPPNGYPTVVFLSFASFTYSSRSLNGTTTTLSANSPNPVLRLMYELVREGVQCIQATVSVARGGSTGNATSDGSYDPESNLYHGAYTNGNGAWVYPGDNPFSDPTATFGEFDREMAVQEILWIVQHLKENSDALNVDASNIFLQGSSAGGFTTGWGALNADLSSHFSAGTDAQNAQSTRVRGWIPFDTPMFMPCMKAATSVAHCFPTDADVDTPAALLNDVYPAGGTIDATNYQWKFSPMAYATAENMVDTLMVYTDATSASKSTTGSLGSLEANIGTNFHDLRFGSMFRRRFPGKTQLVFAPDVGEYDKLARYADLYDNVDHVFEQVADNETDPLTKHIVKWVLSLSGLAESKPGPAAMGYGLANCREFSVNVPGSTDTWTRVLRRNPSRAGPISIQARSFGTDYPAVDFDVVVTPDPQALNMHGMLISSHRSTDGLGVDFLEAMTQLNIGGGELWCRLRHASMAADTSVLTVFEPSY